MAKFQDGFYVRVYQSARDGMKDAQIASQLGVDRATFKKWVARRPAFKEALALGREAAGGVAGESFSGYVYRRLPRRLQLVWDDLQRFRTEENGEKMIDELLRDQGKAVRQHLFLHALVRANFNASEACRQMNMSYSVFEKWKKTDPDFIELVRQVQEMKKDFCESALMGLVRQGDVSAVVFANKTLNRDRGYGLKTEVEYSGGLTHSVLDLSDLDLPPDVMRVVLDAIRRRKELNEAPASGRVIALEPHRVHA